MKLQNLSITTLDSAGNQLSIRDKETNERLFMSYNTPICSKHNGHTILYPKWKYFPTTSKYRNRWLNETTKETQQKISTGKYELKEIHE